MFYGDYTGKAILNALLRKSDELNIHIDDEVCTDILVKDNICFGAVSLKNGEITIHISDGNSLYRRTLNWKKLEKMKILVMVIFGTQQGVV